MPRHPERIRSDDAAAILGVSRRQTQAAARRGELPGAAFILGCWTFDEAALRQFVRDREAEARPCQITSIGAVKRGGAASRSPALSAEERYERLLGL